MQMRAALDSANLVFLDPDNGLGAETEKHATCSEIDLLRRPGRAIVFSTFPGRTMQHNTLAQRLHKQLSAQTGAKEVVTLRTNVSVPAAEPPRSYVQRQRWFTVIDPDAELIARARVRQQAHMHSACPGGVGWYRMSFRGTQNP